MLAKKIKTCIGEDKKLVLYLPDIPNGDIEVIILQEDKNKSTHSMITNLPLHKMGKQLQPLDRENIYKDE